MGIPLRRTPHLFSNCEEDTSPMLQSNQNSLCSLNSSRHQGVEGPNGQVINIKRTVDGRKQRSRNIIDDKKEKYRAKNGFLHNTSTGSKRATFVILKNNTTTCIKKKRLS